MRRRILAAILTITSVAVLLFGIPLVIIVGRFVDDDATLRVERQAVLAARAVPGDFATSGDPVELPAARDNVILGLYNSVGTLVTGHGPPTADQPTLLALRNSVVDHETSATRVVAVPVTGGEAIVGAIRAEQPTRASDARLRQIALLIGSLAAGIVGIGAAIGFVVSGRLARPVRRLSDAAVRLGDGDFTVTMPHSRVPELEEAGQAMTATSRRLDDLVTRARSFSADASHQLRTPLAGLKASIETELAFPRADHTEVLHEALTDIERLERTIAELLTIARSTAIGPSTTLIAPVLDDLRSVWHGPLARRGRPLRIADATRCPAVIGNAATLRHAIDVLLDNALHHGAGEVTIGIAAGPDTVTISVHDQGPGLPSPGQQATNAGGSATRTAIGHEDHGMGLPLARRLIDAMPGRLEIARYAPRPQFDIILAIASTEENVGTADLHH
ncbi:MAG: HAMP domain-containing sensor histidine kinase [Ilumatobacteraceae bacterium]